MFIFDFKMKQILITFFSLTAILLASCGSKNQTPKQVAETYLANIFNADFEGAKKVSTEECKALIEAQKSFYDLQADSSKVQYKKTKWQIVGEPKVDGNNAMVTFTESDMPGNRTIPLLLVDGKWMVNNNKAHLEKQMEEDLNDGATDEAVPVSTEILDSNAAPKK
jgi:hypothetical protein